MNIRTEQPQDIDQITTITNAAFKGEGEAKLISLIRESDYFIPELSLVTEEDGEVIGHILFSKIFIQTNASKVSTLALAPMSVSPEKQRQGIGQQLVRAGLQTAKKLGCQHVFVLGHPEFYPKFGFTPSVEFSITPPFPVGPEYFMAIELQRGSLSEVAGQIVYSPPFSAL
ncbi:GNAT family N-acetyltransferase [Bacillus sp. 2205SS5-2]|uniref:GNAT family N-acetyltransferase n=1 Tax=Bacillus sp. 2205SS5-2 TaxID=3109031 RepID=UPI003005D0AF